MEAAALEAHRASLCLKARAAGFGHEDAEDIASETLFRAVRSGQPGETVTAWLNTILNNLMRDRWQAQTRRPPPLSLEALYDPPRSRARSLHTGD